jgi:hypothetical protein
VLSIFFGEACAAHHFSFLCCVFFCFVCLHSTTSCALFCL